MASGDDLKTDIATSKRFARQKQEGTKPEMLVRSLLSKLGHHYRLSNRDLAGSPDIANRSKKWVVFVHGCYWHHHEGCTRATIPKRNRDFWLDKFKTNRERDEWAVMKLENDGFRVVVVWECELLELDMVRARLAREI